jgi:pilus assembly protein Flp/PilA
VDRGADRYALFAGVSSSGPRPAPDSGGASRLESARLDYRQFNHAGPQNPPAAFRTAELTELKSAIASIGSSQERLTLSWIEHQAPGAKRMIKSLKNFVANESGATAIEYALIASLIAVAIIAAVTAVGTHLQNTFNEVSSNLK